MSNDDIEPDLTEVVLGIGGDKAHDGVMKLIAYERHEAEVKEWNPTALDVFAFVRDSIATVLPGHDIEHIGSTSVPGLRGKGIIDVMVAATNDADTAQVVEQLEALGLEHARGSKPFRPFLLGGVDQTARRPTFMFTWCAQAPMRLLLSVALPKHCVMTSLYATSTRR